VIDANGAIVTPGFVDIHTHYDGQATWDDRLEPSADGHLRHGTSVLGVMGGAGRYAGASGRITSNFVLSPDGEVTDEQVVVLFIDREEEQ